MKIISDGNGKYIFDFEGQEIDVSDVGGRAFVCSCVFNNEVISEVRNGVWLFAKKESKAVASLLLA